MEKYKTINENKVSMEIGYTSPIIPTQEQKQDLHFAFDVPKQETIDEVAVRYYESVKDTNEGEIRYCIDDFKAGWNECLKHQSEKMFSLKDMEKAFLAGFKNSQYPLSFPNFKDWLTQHKKH